MIVGASVFRCSRRQRPIIIDAAKGSNDRRRPRGTTPIGRRVSRSITSALSPLNPTRRLDLTCVFYSQLRGGFNGIAALSTPAGAPAKGSSSDPGGMPEERRGGPMNQRSPSRPAPRWSGRGPGLFAHMYVALLVHFGVFTAALYWGEPSQLGWLVGIWSAMALLALTTAFLRIPFEDGLATLSVLGRLGLLLVLSGAFISPLFFPGHRVNPEGFVMIQFPLMVFSVNGRWTRRGLATSIVGFWFVCSGARDMPLGFVLAFGATTLWTFSCAHFTFMAHSHGLKGWWPVGKIVQTVVLFFVPAALGAFLIFSIWTSLDMPERMTSPPPDLSSLPSYQRIAALRDDVFWNLVLRMVISLALVVLSLIVLHLLRRMLNRRARAVSVPLTPGADVSELEMIETEQPVSRRSLDGTRGQIVRLWRRWSRVWEAPGLARAESETAAALAERVATEEGPTASPEAMTRLFEQAHYGPETPGRKDVDAMKKLVKGAIEKRR